MARGLPGVGQIVPDDMQREGLWAQVQKLLGNTFVEKDSIKIIPPMPGASVELLRIDQIHEIVEPAVSRYLSPMGFESHRQLVWVRSADAPIRQVFKLELLKGAGLDFAWGLSLDFVPHVSGSRVKWHRTPKTAMLDLGVRPRRRGTSGLTYLWGAAPLRARIESAIEEIRFDAEKFWASATVLADLPAVFGAVRDYYSINPGLGFYNFIQHPIAYAFSLAKVGRLGEALMEIERFHHLRDSPRIEARIRELLLAADASS